MGYTSLGEMTLGAVVPVALTATASATASINVQLPELQLKLAALLELSARVTLVPPTIAASILAVANMGIQLGIALSAGAPSVLVDVSAILAAIAEINASIGALTVQLGIILNIEAALGGASVHLLNYEGVASGLVSSGIDGISSSANVNALLIVASTSAAWATMSTVFKTA